MVRHALHQAAAFAAADGPLIRRATQTLLNASFPFTATGEEGAAALVPLDQEVCIEVLCVKDSNAGSGRTPY